jgi:steroid delta-isomerase-like uncharacterized protein
VSAEDDVDLVRAYYRAVYDEHDPGAIDGFLAPGFRSAGPGGEMDLDGHRHALAASLAALPDLRLAIEEQVSAGGAVVTRWTANGTHAGPLFGIPATGRTVTATAIHIHHVAEGRIVDQWEQFDALGVLRQLGALPGGRSADG